MDHSLLFDFTPVFYLLDKNPNELKSIAVKEISENGYEGVYFKRWATGWSTGPIKIGKGFIRLGQFDFTENIDEAIKHAS
jgi:hypothetical protein